MKSEILLAPVYLKKPSGKTVPESLLTQRRSSSRGYRRAPSQIGHLQSLATTFPDSPRIQFLGENAPISYGSSEGSLSSIGTETLLSSALFGIAMETISDTERYLKNLEQRIQTEKDKERLLVQNQEALLSAAATLTNNLDRVYSLLSQIKGSKYSRHSVLFPGLGSLLPVVGEANYPIRIRIENRKERARGLGALLRSGQGQIGFLENEVIGLTSKSQLDLLQEHKIAYTSDS